MAWYVSRLRLKAFKSVGAAWLEVDVSRGLVGLVGPNGSGKSTFLDAICFAFACPPSLLGIQRLSELQSTDTQEVWLHLSSIVLHCKTQARYPRDNGHWMYQVWTKGCSNTRGPNPDCRMPLYDVFLTHFVDFGIDKTIVRRLLHADLRGARYHCKRLKGSR